MHHCNLRKVKIGDSNLKPLINYNHLSSLRLNKLLIVKRYNRDRFYTPREKKSI